SDWGAVHDTWGAAMGGLDLEMPGGSNNNFMADPLLKLVKEGKIPEAIIDDKVTRVLRFIFRITDNPQYKIPVKANAPENVVAARKIADESIVLLKNNNILPLSEKVKTIAVIGPSANYEHAMHGLWGSGGSGSVNPPYEITPLQAIREKFGKRTKIIYSEGITISKALNLVPMANLSYKGKPGLKAEYYANPKFEGNPVLTRIDRNVNFFCDTQFANTDNTPQGLISIKWTGVLKPTESGLYRLGTESDDGSRLYINNQLLVDNWGDHSSRLIAREIKLEAGKEYSIRVEYMNSGYSGEIKLLWSMQVSQEQIHQQALEAAAKADVVLYFGGLDHSYDKEAMGWGDVPGADHADYNLIGNQDQFIQELAKINPNIVVTLFGGAPMNVEPFVNQVKGLLMAWYPGQEGGRAITDILWGKVNPSGKLCCTWGKNITDYACHALNLYPGTRNYGIVNYDEGMFVGYRWFDAKKIEPRFPFGYGLSYTQFNISDVKVENQSTANEVKVIVRCKVKNTGKYEGSEVVQVYNGLPEAGYARPEKELRAYRKVSLKPGEEKQIEITLDKTAFSAYYVSEQSKWQLVKGKSPIYVATSATDIISRQEVNIE
ncbi:MAG: glycoside hydrolase family 3 C-terminal domain-containing protein, partial [Bacteroidota bacterium]|nr:glycoside hydrolase family 3 C-terminal domain-containing protein [Bacteroidota bacterium]